MVRLIFVWLILLFQQVICQVEVNTRLGRVIGFNAKFEEHTLDVFYGVPFGKPPVGKLRFIKSELIDELPYDPYEATEFTSHCPIKEESVLKGAPIKEDCLVLNIWRPSQRGPCSEQVADQEMPAHNAESDLEGAIASVIAPEIKPRVAGEEPDFKPLKLETAPLKKVSVESVKSAGIETRRSKAEEAIRNCNQTYPTIIYFYGGIGSIFMVICSRLKERK